MSKAPETKQEPTKKFSPFAGCSILIIAGVLAAAMIGFSVWSYFKVQDTIAGFTQESPKAIQLTDTTGQETAQVSLKQKLTGFRHNIEAKHKATITLDATELNLAVATFDILKPHRKNIYITSISEDGIEANIAYPTKSAMFSDTMRYLNGTLTLQPELVEGATFPRITRIKADQGNSIPDEFKKFISETLLHPLHNDKELGPLFKSLSRVELQDNTLVLHTDPAYSPPSAPTEETKSTLFQRLMNGFAVVALIFLAIVTIIIILSRRKAKQSPIPHQ